MRPGLVVLGVAFLSIAAATTVAVVTSGGPTTTTSTFSSIGAFDARGGSGSAIFDPGNASSQTFTIAWRATSTFSVALYEGPGCIPSSVGCASPPPIAKWVGNESGTFSITGPFTKLFVLDWTETGSSGGSLSYTATATRSTEATPLPSWDEYAFLAAAGALWVLGALAVFLGFFLRGGVFRGRPRLVSRSADDAEAIARGDDRTPTGPRTGS